VEKTVSSQHPFRVKSDGRFHKNDIRSCSLRSASNGCQVPARFPCRSARISAFQPACEEQKTTGIFRPSAPPLRCPLDRRRDEHSGAVAISVPRLNGAVDRLTDGFPIRQRRYGGSKNQWFYFISRHRFDEVLEFILGVSLFILTRFLVCHRSATTGWCWCLRGGFRSLSLARFASSFAARLSAPLRSTHFTNSYQLPSQEMMIATRWSYLVIRSWTDLSG
jgi:hypothetical protein